MAHGIIIAALLLSTLALSVQEKAHNTDYDYEDDYYDDPKPVLESEEIQKTEDNTFVPAKSLTRGQTRDSKILKVQRDREELTTERPISKYEVTELVIDIPDESTRRVPIISNFTLTRPLNFAAASNNKTDDGTIVKNEGDEIINSVLIPHVINNNQHKDVTNNINKFNVIKDENYDFSNLNPENSFEEEFEEEFGSNEEDSDDDNFKGETKPNKNFKDHFFHFKKSIVNEFKSVVDKHKEGIQDSLRKIVNGPISFFSKLHRKSSDLAKKLHKAVSRHRIHDEDDDVGYHGADRDYEGD